MPDPVRETAAGETTVTDAVAGPGADAARASDRVGIAREALFEITRPVDVGALISETVGDDGVITVLFETTDPGYPGWRWTVSLVQLEGDEPTVLEAELLPGEHALVAPEWVPWSTRLEEWRAQQDAEGGDAGLADGDSDDELDEDSDDEDTDDEDDLDGEDLDEDEDDDEHDDADDLGDDVYDGLDPESALEGAAQDDDESDDDETDDDPDDVDDDWEPASDSR